MTKAELVQAAKNTAQAHGLDPVLVCCVCETESSWVPASTRFEPAFLERYVVPMALPAQQSQDRATSWGLMQIMGQTAVEFGWQGPLEGLLEPLNGLEWGCRKLANCFRLAAKRVAPGRSDYVRQALLLYNGGADPGYPARVLAKLPHYQDASPAINNIGVLGGE